MKTVYVSKNECRSRGGWSSYCEWTEIYDNDNNLVAVVDEEHGEVVLPLQAEGHRSFERTYANRVIPITLLEVKENYLVIEIQNLYNTVKRLYYRPRKNS